MAQIIDRESFQAEMVERAIERSREDVEGRVVVITGGARGIGRAMAEALLRAGAKVAVVDKTLEGADEFGRQLESSGRGIAVEMDVTDDGQIEAAQDAITSALGPADVLINNAALVSETLFAPTGRVKTLDTSDADWKTMFEVNVFGVVKAIRHFIQPMIEKGSGSIVNVVSSGVLPVAGGGGWFGLRPFTLEMPYQSSKAAVMALTFYLGDEVRGQGVAVNAIMPGHTRASWFDTTANAWQEKALSPACPSRGAGTPCSDHAVPRRAGRERRDRHAVFGAGLEPRPRLREIPGLDRPFLPREPGGDVLEGGGGNAGWSAGDGASDARDAALTDLSIRQPTSVEAYNASTLRLRFAFPVLARRSARRLPLLSRLALSRPVWRRPGHLSVR